MLTIALPTSTNHLRSLSASPRSVFFSASIRTHCLYVDKKQNLNLHVCGGPHAINEIFSLDQGKLYHPSTKLCLINPSTLKFGNCNQQSIPGETTTGIIWSFKRSTTLGTFQHVSSLQCISMNTFTRSISMSHICDPMWKLKSRKVGVLTTVLTTDQDHADGDPDSADVGIELKTMGKINGGDTVVTSIPCPALQLPPATNPVRIAFFIRGTKTVSPLIRLLNTIYLPQHLYLVHLDHPNANSVEYNQYKLEQNKLTKHVSNFVNVYQFDHPISYSIHYMDFDLLFLDVRAVLFFLHLSTASTSIKWDYFVNLASMEYPIVSMDQIHKTLEEHRGQNFVDIWCNYNNAPNYKQKRINDLWSHGKLLQRRSHRNENELGKPKGINFYFGSFMVMLTHSFLTSLFDVVENPQNLELLTYLRNVRVADEVFFATAIMNSKQFKCTHFNSNLRYINWGRVEALHSNVTCRYTELKTNYIYGKKYLKSGSHPCILGMGDIKEILEERKNRKNVVWNLFGNKFDSRVDDESLYYLDTKVMGVHVVKKKKKLRVDVDEIDVEEEQMLFNRGERIAPFHLHCPVYKGRGK